VSDHGEVTLTAPRPPAVRHGAPGRADGSPGQVVRTSVLPSPRVPLDDEPSGPLGPVEPVTGPDVQGPVEPFRVSHPFAPVSAPTASVGPPAPSDHHGPGAPEPVARTRVYVDGSALTRYLDGAPCRDDWLAWVAEHEDRLVTTFLGVSELRRVARPRGVEAHGVAHDVTDRVEVVRFSDQSLRAAARVSNVLPSFVALHVGAAVAHPEVGEVATYDLPLAQAATLYGLDVVSPGWPDRWWEQEPPTA